MYIYTGYIYIYIYNKTSIKRNILTIKQNTSGSRSGYGLISIPVLLSVTRLDLPHSSTLSQKDTIWGGGRGFFWNINLWF